MYPMGPKPRADGAIELRARVLVGSKGGKEANGEGRARRGDARDREQRNEIEPWVFRLDDQSLVKEINRTARDMTQRSGGEGERDKR